MTDEEEREWIAQLVEEGDPLVTIMVESPLYVAELASEEFGFDFTMGSDPETHKAVMMRLILSPDAAATLQLALERWRPLHISGGDEPGPPSKH